MSRLGVFYTRCTDIPFRVEMLRGLRKPWEGVGDVTVVFNGTNDLKDNDRLVVNNFRTLDWRDMVNPTIQSLVVEIIRKYRRIYSHIAVIDDDAYFTNPAKSMRRAMGIFELYPNLARVGPVCFPRSRFFEPDMVTGDSAEMVDRHFFTPGCQIYRTDTLHDDDLSYAETLACRHDVFLDCCLKVRGFSLREYRTTSFNHTGGETVFRGMDVVRATNLVCSNYNRIQDYIDNNIQYDVSNRSVVESRLFVNSVISRLKLREVRRIEEGKVPCLVK